MANIAANSAPPAFKWYNPTTWDGEAITQGLRAFNNWRDDFLIELTTLLLMFGFVIGTIDVLTSGGLEKIPFVNWSWAVVQAVAIDGLFFAVWGRIRRFSWSWRTGFQGVMLVFVGLLLAGVAALVNNILGYQQLNNIQSLAQVMATLGVDATIFSYVRATLVVLVSILVALFARSHGPSIRELMATIAQHIEELEGLRAIRETLTKERDSHSERAIALEKDAKGLRVTIAELEAARATWATEREEMAGEIADLKGKLAQARARRGLGDNGLPATLPSRGSGLQSFNPASYSPRPAANGLTTVTMIDGAAGAIALNSPRTDSPAQGAIAQGSAGSNGYHSPTQMATGDNHSPAQGAIADSHSQGGAGYGSPAQGAIADSQGGYVAIDNGLAIAIQNEFGATIIATGEPRERIKMAMAIAMREGIQAKYDDIAQVANVGYSTVKKHAAAIREEIARENTQEFPAIAAQGEETVAAAPENGEATHVESEV